MSLPQRFQKNTQKKESEIVTDSEVFRNAVADAIPLNLKKIQKNK